jgi:hypothetical protein
MFYAIPKACTVCRAGLLGFCLLVVATGALAQDQPRRFLEVTSQGYSRYEISEGDVVAFFTGGVQCTYLGYALVADELRYNQATQVATASGKVGLASASMDLNCDEAVLDGATGQLVVDSNLNGALNDPSVSFTADSAIVHFPPGQFNAGLETLDLELIGDGDTGVQINGPHHSLLVAHRLLFAGKTRAITCPGRFQFTAELDRAIQTPATNGAQQAELQHLSMTGSSLDTVLDASGMFSTAQIKAALLQSDNAELSSPELHLNLLPPAAPDAPGWIVEASGAPIAGRAQSGEQTVSFTTLNARISSSGQDVDQIDLHGGVEVTTDSGVMSAETIQIRQQQRGFSIAAPDGLRVAFDLAALSGNTPVDLPDLSKFAPQE